MRYGVVNKRSAEEFAGLARRQKAKLRGDKKIFNQDIEEIIRQEIIS